MSIAEEARQPTDLRLALPALGTWITALATLGTAGNVALLAAVVLLTGAALSFLVCRSKRWSAAVAAALVCSSAAAGSVGLRLTAVTDTPLRTLAADGREVTAELVVTGRPRVQPPQVRAGRLRRYVLIRGQVQSVRADGEHAGLRAPVLVITAEHGWESLLPGQSVRVRGELGLPRYDELLTAVLFARGPPEVRTRASAPHRVAAGIRAGLREAVAPLPPAERGLLPGLAVGDTSQMKPEVIEEFEDAGLTHLTAVSGTNVTIVLVAVLWLARGLRAGPRAAPSAAGVAIVGFAVLAGPSPSVLRATIMGLIAVLALATGRTRQVLAALCATVVGLLLFAPGLARSYGFALSVLATAGLVVLVPGWTERLSRRMPRWFAEALAVPAAAQVVCLPVVVMLAGRVSLVAVPANLLVTPAVGPATVFGVLAAVAAPFSLSLARLFAQVGGLAAHWIIEVAHAAAMVPYATVPWPSGPAGGLALLVLIVLLAAFIALILARSRLRRLAAVCLAGVVLATVSVRVAAPSWPPRDWLMVMCDVGQGDALVLATGTRSAVVVDTGPDPRRIDTCLRRLGVQRVSLLILTHPHADHVAGLPGVLRGRDIGTALVTGGTEPHQDGFPARAWLRGAGTRVRQASPGSVLTVGSLRLRILGPAERMQGRQGLQGPPASGTGEDRGDGFAEESGATNNASIVVRAAWPGVSALLTGDIEPEAQRRLLDTKVVRADALKVPHHGSAFQAAPFFAAVRPRVALISVGAKNDYGHPAPETLNMLAGMGVRTYRSDRDGAVALVRRYGDLAVVTRERSKHGILPLWLCQRMPPDLSC